MKEREFTEIVGQFSPYWTEKPWGREFVWALTADYCGKLLYINRGARLSLQFHEEKDETIFVQQGPVLVQHGAEGAQELEVEPGGVIHVTPGTLHRFGAPEGGPVVLFEVSTPHLDDVVRMADDYGRDDTRS